MSVFRGNGLKFFALSAALFAATAPSRSAFATLGEPEVTVQNDVTLARATIKSSQERDSYRVHEIQLPSGTVMREFVGLDGKVFAKTGTLGEARALSGYVVAASGQTVAFSIMCTDHSPSLPADRTAMDKIVAAIAEAN